MVPALVLVVVLLVSVAVLVVLAVALPKILAMPVKSIAWTNACGIGCSPLVTLGPPANGAVEPRARGVDS